MHNCDRKDSVGAVRPVSRLLAAVALGNQPFVSLGDIGDDGFHMTSLIEVCEDRIKSFVQKSDANNGRRD
jgi:hypothetical protein